MYADDLLLISASIIDLQAMLDICADIGSSLGILFNSTKSKCITIGPNEVSIRANLTIAGAPLKWENSIKYLGITVCSASRFEIDLSDVRRKFFASVNAILSKCKYSNETVNLQLVESHCLPILLFAIESLNLKNSQVKDLNSWWNAVFRKIFKYNKWESVKELIFLLERLDVVHLIYLRRLKFIKNAFQYEHVNSIMRNIMKYYCHTSEFYSVLHTCNVQSQWTFSKMKAVLYDNFKSKVTKN